MEKILGLLKPYSNETNNIAIVKQPYDSIEDILQQDIIPEWIKSGQTIFFIDTNGAYSQYIKNNVHKKCKVQIVDFEKVQFNPLRFYTGNFYKTMYNYNFNEDFYSKIDSLLKLYKDIKGTEATLLERALLEKELFKLYRDHNIMKNDKLPLEEITRQPYPMINTLIEEMKNQDYSIEIQEKAKNLIDMLEYLLLEIGWMFNEDRNLADMINKEAQVVYFNLSSIYIDKRFLNYLKHIVIDTIMNVLVCRTNEHEYTRILTDDRNIFNLEIFQILLGRARINKIGVVSVVHSSDAPTVFNTSKGLNFSTILVRNTINSDSIFRQIKDINDLQII